MREYDTYTAERLMALGHSTAVIAMMLDRGEVPGFEEVTEADRAFRLAVEAMGDDGGEWLNATHGPVLSEMRSATRRAGGIW